MWQYNYEYLSHGTGGYKYIDKKWKNGKWKYTYPSVMSSVDRAVSQDKIKKEKENYASELEKLSKEGHDKFYKPGSTGTAEEREAYEKKLVELYTKLKEKYMIDPIVVTNTNTSGKKSSFEVSKDTDKEFAAKNIYYSIDNLIKKLRK